MGHIESLCAFSHVQGVPYKRIHFLNTIEQPKNVFFWSEHTVCVGSLSPSTDSRSLQSSELPLFCE